MLNSTIELQWITQKKQRKCSHTNGSVNTWRTTSDARARTPSSWTGTARSPGSLAMPIPLLQALAILRNSGNRLLSVRVSTGHHTDWGQTAKEVGAMGVRVVVKAEIVPGQETGDSHAHSIPLEVAVRFAEAGKRTASAIDVLRASAIPNTLVGAMMGASAVGADESIALPHLQLALHHHLVAHAQTHRTLENKCASSSYRENATRA